MAVLILDSEAMSSLAQPHDRPDRHAEVQAALRSSVRANRPTRVPSAVLVEVLRGRGTDEPIDRILARGIVRVVTTGARIARIAGHLLGAASLDSSHAIDALVVATAARLGGGIVLTHDPDDMKRLAAALPNVVIAAI